MYLEVLNNASPEKQLLAPRGRAGTGPKHAISIENDRPEPLPDPPGVGGASQDRKIIEHLGEASGVCEKRRSRVS